MVNSTSRSHDDGTMGDIRFDIALGASDDGFDADVGTGDMTSIL